MKKLLLFIAFVFAVMCIQAQDTVRNEPYYFYCQFKGVMQASGRIKPNKMLWNGNKDEQKLYDASGEEMQFNNIVEVINYMAKKGWELDNTIVYTSWFYYIFKKKVTNDKEAKEGLFFESDFSRKK